MSQNRPNERPADRPEPLTPDPAALKGRPPPTRGALEEYDRRTRQLKDKEAAGTITLDDRERLRRWCEDNNLGGDVDAEGNPAAGPSD